jgi:hypothetical protein
VTERPGRESARARKVLGPWQAATVVVGIGGGCWHLRSASGVAQMLESGPMLLWPRRRAGCSRWPTPSPMPSSPAAFRVRAVTTGSCARPSGRARPSVRLVAVLGDLRRFGRAARASSPQIYLAQIVPLSDPAKAGVAALAVIALTAVKPARLAVRREGRRCWSTLDVLALLALGGAALWLTVQGAAAADADDDRRGQGKGVIAAVAGGAGPVRRGDGVHHAGLWRVQRRRHLSAEVEAAAGHDPGQWSAAWGLVTLLYLLANWAYLPWAGTGWWLPGSERPGCGPDAAGVGPAGPAGDGGVRVHGGDWRC